MGRRLAKILIVILAVLVAMATLYACNKNDGVDTAPILVSVKISNAEFIEGYDPAFPVCVEKDAEGICAPVLVTCVFSNIKGYNISKITVNGKDFATKDYEFGYTTEEVSIRYTPKPANDDKEYLIKVSKVIYSTGPMTTKEATLRGTGGKILVAPDFTVTVNMQNADSDPKEATFKATYGKTVNGDGGSLPSSDDVYKESFDFLGFFPNSDGTGTVVEGTKPFLFNHDVTLYSRFVKVFEATLYANSATITGLTQYGKGLKELNIPTHIQGKPVTELGASAFVGSNATYVTMPDSVTKIGERCFKDMTELWGSYRYETITNPTTAKVTVNKFPLPFTLSTGLIEIGREAFSGCVSIGGTKSGVTNSFSFEKNTALRTIGDRAFDGCGWSTMRPQGTTSVSYPLDGKSLVIMPSVQTIGAGAFQNSKFNNVYIMYGNPDLEIGKGAFSGSKELNYFNSATLWDGSGKLYSPDTASGEWGLKVIPDEFMANCPKLSRVLLREGLREIGASAFASAKKLTTLSIPNTISVIREFAFNDCDLTDIIFCDDASLGYSGLTELRSNAFAQNARLREVTIKSKKLEYYSQTAFRGSMFLKAIYLYTDYDTANRTPRLDTSWHGPSDTWSNSPYLKIYVSGRSVSAYENAWKNSVSMWGFASLNVMKFASRDLIIYKDRDVPIEGSWKVVWSGGKFHLEPETYKVRDSYYAVEIVKDAQGNETPAHELILLTYLKVDSKGGDEKNIVVPETINDNGEHSATLGNQRYTIVEIGAYFSHNEIVTVSLPPTIRVIRKYAFYYCENLTSVELRGSSQLTTIGESAFTATALTVFNAPNYLSEIGEQAFLLCKYLAEVTLMPQGNGDPFLVVRERAFEQIGLSQTASIKVRIGVNVQKIYRNAFNINSTQRRLQIYFYSATPPIFVMGYDSFLPFMATTDVYVPRTVGATAVIAYREIFPNQTISIEEF